MTKLLPFPNISSDNFIIPYYNLSPQDKFLIVYRSICFLVILTSNKQKQNKMSPCKQYENNRSMTKEKN